MLNLKTPTVGKFYELKDKFNLCDIWRIKHPKTKTFTFRQKPFFWFYSAKIGLQFCFAKSSEKNKKCLHFKRSFNRSFASFFIFIK